MKHRGVKLLCLLLCVGALCTLAIGASAAKATRPAIDTITMMPIDGGVRLIAIMRAAPEDTEYRWQILDGNNWSTMPDSNQATYERIGMENGKSYAFRLIAQNARARQITPRITFTYSSAQDALLPAAGTIEGKATPVLATPSLKGTKLSMLKIGESVTVLGFEKAFVMIEHTEAPSGFAYISANYLNMALEPALDAIVSKRCDLFSDKNTKKETRITTIPKDTPLKLMSREGAWWRTEWEGKMAYVQAGFVTLQ